MYTACRTLATGFLLFLVKKGKGTGERNKLIAARKYFVAVPLSEADKWTNCEQSQGVQFKP
jgi:hypothetical protein